LGFEQQKKSSNLQRKTPMVYIPKEQKMEAEEMLEHQVARHRELKAVESPLQGILFQYIPEDFAADNRTFRYYIRLLNEAIYGELRGQRYLFHQQIGDTFLLRISFCVEAPPLPAIQQLIQRILLIGREVDAAMRAAAFSH